MKNMTVKKWIGLALKIGLAIVVFTLEISESMNFFGFIFPAEKWYLAYTGLGLTSGAMLVYMYLFAFDTDTTLQKTIALVMAVGSLFAAILTAGFGMQVETWKTTGFVMAQSDVDFMILVIRILLFVHGIALLMYFSGDKVITAFGDEDGDGTPNWRDPDFKRKQPQVVRGLASDAELVRLREENAKLKAEKQPDLPNPPGRE